MTIPILRGGWNFSGMKVLVAIQEDVTVQCQHCYVSRTINSDDFGLAHCENNKCAEAQGWK